MNTHITHTAAFIGIVAALIGFILIVTTVPVHAEVGTSTATSTKPRPSVDNTCMAEAVSAREEAIAAAWEVFSADITVALAERKTNLIAAWNKETLRDRTSAMKNTWKDWHSSSKAAHTELRNERKSAWENFKKTARSECKLSIPPDEALERAKTDTIAL